MLAALGWMEPGKICAVGPGMSRCWRKIFRSANYLGRKNHDLGVWFCLTDEFLSHRQTGAAHLPRFLVCHLSRPLTFPATSQTFCCGSPAPRRLVVWSRTARSSSRGFLLRRSAQWSSRKTACVCWWRWLRRSRGATRSSLRYWLDRQHPRGRCDFPECSATPAHGILPRIRRYAPGCH